MKIAIIAPLVTAIREPQLGGSQAFVSDLARGLADRGHDVHVFAASGSQIPGVRVIDTGADPHALAGTLYRADAPAGRAAGAAGAARVAFAAAETAFAAAYARAGQAGYDVIHNHAFDEPAVRLATALPVPVLHTLHLPPDEPMLKALALAARSVRPPAVATVSAFQQAAWGRDVRVDAILRPCVPTHVHRLTGTPGHGAVFAGRAARKREPQRPSTSLLPSGYPSTCTATRTTNDMPVIRLARGGRGLACGFFRPSRGLRSGRRWPRRPSS